MTARVIGIESGSKFVDGKRRIALRLEGASTAWDEIRATDEELSVIGLSLDDVLDVEFTVRREARPTATTIPTATCSDDDPSW